MGPFTVTAELSNLSRIRDFVLARAREEGFPDTLTHKLDLVLEEVVVNVISHAYGDDGGAMEIDCAKGPDGFCVTVRDWGVPFNPLEASQPEHPADVDERQVGGLGLMFVTTMSNNCFYRNVKKTNELTFCFTV